MGHKTPLGGKQSGIAPIDRYMGEATIWDRELSTDRWLRAMLKNAGRI